MTAPATNEREAAEKKMCEAARKEASEIWESAPKASADHPYLARKRVGPATAIGAALDALAKGSP